MTREEHIKGIQASAIAIHKETAIAIVNNIYDDFAVREKELQDRVNELELQSIQGKTCDTCIHQKTIGFDNTCNECIRQHYKLDKWEAKEK